MYGKVGSAHAALHHIDLVGHVVQGFSVTADPFGGLGVGDGNEENGSVGEDLEIGAGIDLVAIFDVMGG